MDSKKIKPILSEKVYQSFNDAIIDRNSQGQISETTFIGINSATIKEHKKKSAAESRGGKGERDSMGICNSAFM